MLPIIIFVAWFAALFLLDAWAGKRQTDRLNESILEVRTLHRVTQDLVQMMSLPLAAVSVRTRIVDGRVVPAASVLAAWQHESTALSNRNMPNTVANLVDSRVRAYQSGELALSWSDEHAYLDLRPAGTPPQRFIINSHLYSGLPLGGIEADESSKAAVGA